MATHHSIRKTVQAAAPVIPDKLYFRIGDVAKLCEVPAYVLRFWETEFPQLKPNKGGTGQRLYRKKDVEMALRVKSLLYDQGYTIPGARQVFKDEQAKKSAPVEMVAAAPAPMAAVQPMDVAAVKPLRRDDVAFAALRAEMQELLTMLSQPVSSEPAAVANKVKAMKPRLMLEPKPAPVMSMVPKAKLTLQITPRDSAQRGLFGGSFDDDPGPMAS